MKIWKRSTIMQIVVTRFEYLSYLTFIYQEQMRSNVDLKKLAGENKYKHHWGAPPHPWFSNILDIFWSNFYLNSVDF